MWTTHGTVTETGTVPGGSFAPSTEHHTITSALSASASTYARAASASSAASATSPGGKVTTSSRDVGHGSKVLPRRALELKELTAELSHP